MHRRLHLAGDHSDLTDGVWASIAPLVTGRRDGPGRPARDHRVVVNGILWVLDTGAAWRHVPVDYGPWQTLYGRYARWCSDGTWCRVVDALRAQSARVPRTSRVGRRATVAVMLALLAVLRPPPAHAQQVLLGRVLQPLPAHVAARVGRRRSRLGYGVRPPRPAPVR